MPAAANLRRNGQNSLRDKPRNAQFRLMGQGMWTAAGAGHGEEAGQWPQ